MMRRRRAAVFAAVVLGLVADGDFARAGETVGIFRVDIDGVSKTAADKFEQSLEEGLTGTGFRVVTRDKLRKGLKGELVPGCYFGACLKPIYKHLKIRLVLVARITSAGPNYNFIVSLLDARSGMPTSQVADRCEVCTLEEAIASATLAVIALATGTGTAKVTDPVEGPTRAADLPGLRATIAQLQHRVHHNAALRRRRRQYGWLFVGLAVLAANVGVAQATRCDDRGAATCWLGTGASGALGLAGITLLVLSR